MVYSSILRKSVHKEVGNKGMDIVCYKKDTCSMFERRTINWVEGACAHCKLPKLTNLIAFYCKIGLGIVFILSFATVYVVY